MATLELNHLTKRFGAFTAVNGLELQAADGEMIALLGGSGCGKTTTLRMIAGFLDPDAGTILVNGRDVSKIPPYKRNIGIFFQNYALFPHMTVFENVAFGLKLQKLKKRMDERVKALQEDALYEMLAEKDPELKSMLENEREKYEAFFKTFGVQLKFGVYANYGAEKDDLKDLLLFRSSAGEAR